MKIEITENQIEILKGIIQTYEEAKSGKKDSRDPTIEKVYQLFEEYIGVRPVPVKNKNGFDLNRGSVIRLVKKWGEGEYIRMLTKVLEAQQKDKYTPKTANPLDFEANLGKWKIYFKQKEPNKINEILK